MSIATTVERRGRRVVIRFDDADPLECDRSFRGTQAIKPGQTIDDQILLRLRDEAVRHAAELTAVRWLAKRARSRTDIARRLRRERIPEDVVADTLAALEAQGYLDDEAYATAWTEERLRLRPRARRTIERELRAAGIAADVAAAAVVEIDDRAVAETIVTRHPALRQNAWEVFERRAGGQLARRGYAYDVVRGVLRAAWQDRHGADEALTER
jgi:regulatory protein